MKNRTNSQLYDDLIIQLQICRNRLPEKDSRSLINDTDQLIRQAKERRDEIINILNTTIE